MATEGPGLQEGAALRDGCAPSGIRQPGRSVRCGPTQGKCPGEGNSQEHGSTVRLGRGAGRCRWTRGALRCGESLLEPNGGDGFTVCKFTKKR